MEINTQGNTPKGKGKGKQITKFAKKLSVRIKNPNLQWIMENYPTVAAGVNASIEHAKNEKPLHQDDEVQAMLVKTLELKLEMIYEKCFTIFSVFENNKHLRITEGEKAELAELQQIMQQLEDDGIVKTKG